MSEIGAAAKVIDHSKSICMLSTLIPVDGVQFLPKASFLIVSIGMSLSLCFMCSDQHIKYRMPCGQSAIAFTYTH